MHARRRWLRFVLTVILLPSLFAIDPPTVRGGEAAGDTSAIEDITWTLGPNHPEFRKGGCLATLDGKVISVFGMRQPWGEMATMYLYDPDEQWWQRGPDAPVGQCYVRGTHAGGAFWSIGGRGALVRGKVHPACFRLANEEGRFTWERMADLNESRGWAPSVAVDGKLYVLGGSQGGHGPTVGGVEMLDWRTAGAKWQRIAEIPGPTRGWNSAAAAGGKIYLVGGLHFYDAASERRGERLRLDELWQLDPETRQWTAKRPIPFPLAGADCCVLDDRYIVLIGGAADTSAYSPHMRKLREQDRFHKSYYNPFVLVYDTATDR